MNKTLKGERVSLSEVEVELGPKSTWGTAKQRADARRAHQSHGFRPIEVYHGVQAALLNSQCDPDDATFEGLIAVCEFAMTDLDAPIEDLRRMLERAWVAAQQRVGGR